MNRPILLLLASLLSVSTADAAQTTKVGCGAIHVLRNSDSEILTGTISVRNIDLANAVTIERLTYRNFFGDVVHDSGPAIGVPHPLNADFTPPQDITVVPPGATYYLSTNHIDRKSTRLNSSHGYISYAVFCLKKKKKKN